MECAGKRKGTRCIGPPVKRCARCDAVAYCSVSHQLSHWSDHKEECKRLEKQKKYAATLTEFPFTFHHDDMAQQGNMCSFLEKRGLHQVGMWFYECSCGALASSFSSKDFRISDCWNLSNLSSPCSEPQFPSLKNLISWKEYYKWRGLPLDSPVALLLHWPLTIYHGLQLVSSRNKGAQGSRLINIHYLGPDKELCQLAVFAELHALLPSYQVHIDLVGPAVPQHRGGEKITLYNYAQCGDGDCKCKISGNKVGCNASSGASSAVKLRLFKGFYHDCFPDMVKDSFPDLIIAPNAGIAAYPSWLETIELIKGLNVPAVFSDYCEEAAQLAVRCLSSKFGCSLMLPIQLNPFRQPLAVENSVLHIPCYSNCYLFGI